ncbi:MAG TPA: 50S ribosomal protein L21 [Planctomycetota bacterium]|nr:50S ribosomal protein L21 [Planctomycetota bacterium]
MAATYAIIEDRSLQYRVRPGERVRLAFHEAWQPDEAVTFDKVCLVGGDTARIGRPYVEGASVTARVVGRVAGPKLVIQKFRRRKNSRRRTGFRAVFTEVEIQSINA